MVGRLLRVGLRLPQQLEWTGELGYAAYRFHAPGIVEGRTGIGFPAVSPRADE